MTSQVVILRLISYENESLFFLNAFPIRQEFSSQSILNSVQTGRMAKTKFRIAPIVRISLKVILISRAVERQNTPEFRIGLRYVVPSSCILRLPSNEINPRQGSFLQ